MTQPTAEQLEVTQADRDAAWPFRPDCFGQHDEDDWKSGLYDDIRVIRAFARHRQATEARMSAAVKADVEKVARIIDPSSWAVMDGYLSDMLRKYKGQNIGYDPDAFKHKPSMKIAEKVLAAIRSQSNG